MTGLIKIQPTSVPALMVKILKTNTSQEEKGKESYR